MTTYEVYVPSDPRGGANSYYFRIERVARAWLAAAVEEWSRKSKDTRALKPSLLAHDSDEPYLRVGDWPEVTGTSPVVVGGITRAEVVAEYAANGWKI
jgi:hypothetical protein